MPIERTLPNTQDNARKGSTNSDPPRKNSVFPGAEVLPEDIDELKERYPKHVPVVVERIEGCDLPDIKAR